MKKMRLLFLSSMVFLSISLVASAVDVTIDIVDGDGWLDLGVGTVDFSNAQASGDTTFSFQATAEELSTVTLPDGDYAYTSFWNVTLPDTVSFNATLTLQACDWITGFPGGASAKVYTRDGGDWTVVASGISIENGGDAYLMTYTGINSFSDWGFGGDDPPIPEPGVLTILAGGLLLFVKKRRK